MTIIFVILIILTSVILGAIVLIQNPKGGGLAGSFAGFSTQFMGVKQTNDVLDKGTWFFAALLAILSITSGIFIGGKSADLIETVGPAPAAPGTQPGAAPFQQGAQQPATPDSN